MPRVKAKNDSLQGATVSAEELALLFGVARESIPRMVRDEGMPKLGWGRYPVIDCVRWYIEKLRGRKSDDSTELAEERRKLIVAQRHHQELQNAKERGELLDAGLVSTAIQSYASTVAAQLDALGPRVAHQVAMLTDPAQIRRVIFDATRDIRRAASGAVEAFAGDVAGLEDTDRPAKKARRRVGGRSPGATGRQPGAGAVAD